MDLIFLLHFWAIWKNDPFGKSEKVPGLKSPASLAIAVPLIRCYLDSTLNTETFVRKGRNLNTHLEFHNLMFHSLQGKRKRRGGKKEDGTSLKRKTLSSLREQNLSRRLNRHFRRTIPQELCQMRRVYESVRWTRNGFGTSRRPKPKALLQVLLCQDFRHLCFEHHRDVDHCSRDTNYLTRIVMSSP